MTSRKYERKCDSCGYGRLTRNGHRQTRRGKVQRWTCTACGASTTLSRPSRRQAWRAQVWISWLVYGARPATAGVSMRSFQRHTRSFWRYAPGPDFNGVVRDILACDATWIGGAMCHIVAAPPAERGTGRRRSRATMVAWSWAATESGTSRGALMARIPPPKVLHRRPTRHCQSECNPLARHPHPDLHSPRHAQPSRQDRTRPTSSPCAPLATWQP